MKITMTLKISQTKLERCSRVHTSATSCFVLILPILHPSVEKICSVDLCNPVEQTHKLTNKQTNKQTDTSENITSLSEGIMTNF